MKAFVFPGQGSQYVGMGLDLSESFPEAKHVFEEIDDTLEQNLSKIMFEGPEEELILTENTQPALMAVSIAVIKILKKRGFELSGVSAGHSLGEYTALTASNSFSIKDAALTLKVRGKAMQRSVGKNKGSMAAILGLNIDQIEEIISRNKLQDNVFIANDNADGQVVLSGLKESIESSLEIFKENGARKAMKLPVSAPFHCPLMRSAQDIMEKTLSTIKLDSPDIPVISNVTVDFSSDENLIKNNLVNQVTEMVRWRETMIKFLDLGVKEFYEIGSGSVLSNLAKRSCPSFKRKSAGNKDSVESLLLELDF
tara:strand:- start:779 stop:1711 length:933 start_codon:yes stop_codon:yes gene_type:complete